MKLNDISQARATLQQQVRSAVDEFIERTDGKVKGITIEVKFNHILNMGEYEKDKAIKKTSTVNVRLEI